MLENKLHAMKLQEISAWSERQKELYRKYYEELRQVNSSIIRPEALQAIQKQKARL